MKILLSLTYSYYILLPLCDILARPKGRGFLQGKPRVEGGFRTELREGRLSGVPTRRSVSCGTVTSAPILWRVIACRFPRQALSPRVDATGDVRRRRQNRRFWLPARYDLATALMSAWYSVTQHSESCIETPPANVENRCGRRCGTFGWCTPGSRTERGSPPHGLCPRCVR